MVAWRDNHTYAFLLFLHHLKAHNTVNMQPNMLKLGKCTHFVEFFPLKKSFFKITLITFFNSVPVAYSFKKWPIRILGHDTYNCVLIIITHGPIDSQYVMSSDKFFILFQILINYSPGNQPTKCADFDHVTNLENRKVLASQL
jgi:hypothetical protein